MIHSGILAESKEEKKKAEEMDEMGPGKSLKGNRSNLTGSSNPAGDPSDECDSKKKCIACRKPDVREKSTKHFQIIQLQGINFNYFNELLYKYEMINIVCQTL